MLHAKACRLIYFLSSSNAPELVNLYLPDGSLLTTTDTDANGEFLFSNLGEGIDYVEIVPPAEHTVALVEVGDDRAVDSDIYVDSGRSDSIFFQSGVPNLEVDAGLRPLPERANLGTLTSLDEAGEPEEEEQRIYLPSIHS